MDAPSPALVYADDDRDFTVEAMMDMYRRGGFGDARPMDRPELFTAMREHSGFFVTARDPARGGQLVGLARCLSDRVWVTYLADLMVDADYRKHGVGRTLLDRSCARYPQCRLVLMARPEAEAFYHRSGMTPVPHAWTRLDKGWMTPSPSSDADGADETGNANASALGEGRS